MNETDPKTTNPPFSASRCHNGEREIPQTSQEVQRKSFEMRLFTFAFVLEVIYGQDVSCDR